MFIESTYRPAPAPENKLILVVLGLFMLWSMSLGHAAEGIRQVPLTSSRITPIAVAEGEGTTTLLFPGELDAIRAGKAVAKPQPGADFLLSYEPGRHYLTLRALHPSAMDALTVIYQGKAYVFALMASERPDYSVTLTDDDTGNDILKPVTPARLTGALDKAKAYHALAKDSPEALESVDYKVFGEEFGGEDFSLQLEEGWRFNQLDTLVFHVTVTNHGENPLRYAPGELAIRVGDQLLSPSLLDATGEVPPHGQETLFLAITGTPEGGRGHYSLDNEWSVILPRLPELTNQTEISASLAAGEFSSK